MQFDLLGRTEKSCLDCCSVLFCTPLIICSHPSSSSPPSSEGTLHSFSEGVSFSKPCALQNLLSKDNPLWLLQFTPAKNEVINEARTCLFSPGSTREAQLNKYSMLLQPAWLGVRLQVAKSTAKCNCCHALHPLTTSQMRANRKDLSGQSYIPSFPCAGTGVLWASTGGRGWLSLMLFCSFNMCL